MTFLYLIIGILLLVLIAMEILRIQINQYVLKIAYVGLMFEDKFSHSISNWELWYRPIIASTLKFPASLIAGYYSSYVISTIVKHYFSIDILPYLEINFETDSITKILAIIILFILALFMIEADNSTPLVRKMLESVRQNIKLIIKSKIHSESSLPSLSRKADVLVSKFYELVGLKELLTLKEKKDEFYAQHIIYEGLNPFLTKVFYEQGGSFVVGFLMKNNADMKLCWAVFPAYSIALLVRFITLRRIKDVFVLYEDFANEISTNLFGVRSKLFASIPDSNGSRSLIWK